MFMDIESNHSFADRANNLLTDIHNLPGPIDWDNVGEEAGGVVKCIFLIAVIGGIAWGLGSLLTLSVTYNAPLKSYVKEITPEKIVFMNKKWVKNDNSLEYRVGDYVIYTDPMPGKIKIKGGILYGRGGDGKDLSIGWDKIEHTENHIERYILQELTLQEQAAIFAENPNAIADKIDGRNTLDEITKTELDDTLTALRRRALELRGLTAEYSR
jgi:hypothetical protein